MRPTAVQLLEHPWIRSNVKDPTGGFSPQGLDGSAGCAHPALRCVPRSQPESQRAMKGHAFVIKLATS